ncbi:putative sur7 protein [Diaporthe ampelina]|uniref:Putative sur7 protein n=1 Tax=Diaporthe ampelina TaxID=1214573 RepID=A0A0G2FYH8_9PEZI|nr:putative sur7 protein [Diaporthe ampelina]
MGLRVTAAAPAIASIAATALGIVLLASGSSTGTANNNYWIALNTSKIGQDLIQITPADQSSGSDGSSDDPLGDLEGIINGIPGLDGILDNLTNSVDQGLNDLSGTILGNLTEALGVKDTYRLYTTKMCQGSFRNEDDPDSGVDIDACFTYRDQGQGLTNITNSIPSSLTVGTAQVSVPLVATLKQTLQSTVSLAATAATVMMVLLIIGCISTATTAIGSSKIPIRFPC